MNKNQIRTILALGGLSVSLSSILSVQADASKLGQIGSVQVISSETSAVIDPENPETSVNPGEGPSTNEILRFDFAPSLRFGSQTISSGIDT